MKVVGWSWIQGTCACLEKYIDSKARISIDSNQAARCDVGVSAGPQLYKLTAPDGVL